MSENWKTTIEDFETLAISATSAPDKFLNCIVPPIVTTSIFEMPDVYGMRSGKSDHKFEYGSYGNPTRALLEEALAKFDGAKHALSFGSGAGAVSCVVSLLNSGDHAVAMRSIYGGGYKRMKEESRHGISVDFLNSGKADAILNLCKPNTKMIWLESPANPTFQIAEVEKITKGASERGIIVVLDNTISTPIFQRPLALGVDIVVYSCSKYMGGHGDLVIGSLSTNSDDFHKELYKIQQGEGNVAGPFDIYLLIRSLKTLPLRMQQHSKSALRVAEFLENHPKIEKVVHPGLKSHPDHELSLKQQTGHGGLFGFYIKNAKLEQSRRFVHSLKVIKMATSLGSDVSVVGIPNVLSHFGLSDEEKGDLGLTENYIRLSVGLENSDAIINDLKQALLQI